MENSIRNELNPRIVITEENERIVGVDDIIIIDERIVGTDDDDIIEAGGGRDTIIGGLGNDKIFGGDGNDILIGADLTTDAEGNDNFSNNAGRGEIDTLIGGAGRDTFALGSLVENAIFGQAFYDDGDASNSGLDDFAIIKDFELGIDRVLVIGSTADYLVGTSPIAEIQGEALFIDTNQNGELEQTDELVAIFEGVDDFNKNTEVDFAGGLIPTLEPEPDAILGSAAEDELTGTEDNDRIFGRDGGDILQGGLGSDELSGGEDNDTLNGTDTAAEVEGSAGIGEIDVLRGGNGIDLFQLAFERLGAAPGIHFYDDGDSTTQGINDFAVIQGFEAGVDQLSLLGFRENYVIGNSPVKDFQGDALFLDTNRNGQLNSTDELIAVFEGSNNLESILATGDEFIPFVDSFALQPDDVLFRGEVESNNNLRTANDLGNTVGQPVGIRGRISEDESDTRDIFKFEVDQSSQLNARLLSNNENFLTGNGADSVNIRLIKDFNGDNQIGFNDLLSSTAFIGDADQLRFDRLDPGIYFLQVGKRLDGETINYDLIVDTQAIERAELQLDLKNIALLDNISGDTPVRFEAEVGDQTFAQRFEEDFNRTVLTAEVDVDQREIPVAVRAFRLNADGSETQIDLDQRRGDLEFDATFDTLTRKLFKTGAGININEGQAFARPSRGDGLDGFLSLAVTYDTFTQDSDPDPFNIELFVPGTHEADTLRGTEVNEMFTGLASNDRIMAGGGDDIAVGGQGNDILKGGTGADILIGGAGGDRIVGGTGDDLLDGGVGNDVYIGGTGADIFAIAAGQGKDRIRDFQDGRDRIGLSSGLTFDALEFTQIQDRVLIATGDEQLAIVLGTNVRQLTNEDFISLDTRNFEGITIPIPSTEASAL